MNITTSTKKNMNPEGNLKFIERFSYGIGDFANNIVYSAVTIFLVFYYTDVIGVSAGIIGTIMLISRIFDGITDLFMGVIVDRTVSKHGKAKIWILKMAIPYALSGIVLFSVPINSSETFKIIYIFISYNLMALIYTALNVPYSTMNALITQNQYERGLLGIFRMMFATAGTLFINSFTLKTVKILGDTPKAWTGTFIIFGLFSAAILMFTFLGTTERVIEEEHKENVTVKNGVTALFKNKYWCIVSASIFCLYFVLTISGASGVYFAKNILGDQNLLVTIGNASTIAQVLTMFFTAIFIKKLGKRNSFFLGIISMILGSIIMIMFPIYKFIIIGNILKGIGSGFIASCMFGMLSDTIEYGEWKNGVRVAGLSNAASSFGSKVGSGLGGATMGWVLSLSGYDGTATVQTKNALFAINALYIYIPLIILLVVSVIIYFYKLDHEYPKIVEELKERNKK